MNRLSFTEGSQVRSAAFLLYITPQSWVRLQKNKRLNALSRWIKKPTKYGYFVGRGLTKVPKDQVFKEPMHSRNSRHQAIRKSLAESKEAAVAAPLVAPPRQAEATLAVAPAEETRHVPADSRGKTRSRRIYPKTILQLRVSLP